MQLKSGEFVEHAIKRSEARLPEAETSAARLANPEYVTPAPAPARGSSDIFGGAGLDTVRFAFRVNADFTGYSSPATESRMVQTLRDCGPVRQLQYVNDALDRPYGEALDHLENGSTFSDRITILRYIAEHTDSSLVFLAAQSAIDTLYLRLPSAAVGAVEIDSGFGELEGHEAEFLGFQYGATERPTRCAFPDSWYELPSFKDAAVMYDSNDAPRAFAYLDSPAAEVNGPIFRSLMDLTLAPDHNPKGQGEGADEHVVFTSFFRTELLHAVFLREFHLPMRSINIGSAAQVARFLFELPKGELRDFSEMIRQLPAEEQLGEKLLSAVVQSPDGPELVKSLINVREQQGQRDFATLVDHYVDLVGTLREMRFAFESTLSDGISHERANRIQAVGAELQTRIEKTVGRLERGYAVGLDTDGGWIHPDSGFMASNPEIMLLAATLNNLDIELLNIPGIAMDRIPVSELDWQYRTEMLRLYWHTRSPERGVPDALRQELFRDFSQKLSDPENNAEYQILTFQGGLVAFNRIETTAQGDFFGSDFTVHPDGVGSLARKFCLELLTRYNSRGDYYGHVRDNNDRVLPFFLDFGAKVVDTIDGGFFAGDAQHEKIDMLVMCWKQHCLNGVRVIRNEVVRDETLGNRRLNVLAEVVG